MCHPRRDAPASSSSTDWPKLTLSLPMYRIHNGPAHCGQRSSQSPQPLKERCVAGLCFHHEAGREYIVFLGCAGGHRAVCGARSRLERRRRIGVLSALAVDDGHRIQITPTTENVARLSLGLANHS
jgi:hypothetical protein